MIDIATEPSTQTPVDLTGLSPEERLWAAMCECADPATYHGTFNCLVHQTNRALELAPTDVGALAVRFGVSYERLFNVYSRACEDGSCRRNLPAALAMAREELGLPEKPT